MNIEQFCLERLGVLMTADPNLPAEAWGILNPASARDKDGVLRLFPRAVAEGNFSRIESVIVTWDDGTPVGVKREGIALEPEKPYEHDKRSLGGVEDPRITFIRPLGVYAMAYVALGRIGPRIAAALSTDGVTWRKLGLLRFHPEANVDFSRYGNKDAAFFPDSVIGPDGKPALAVLHRPTYLVPHRDGTVEKRLPQGIEDDRGSIWISYISLEQAERDPTNLTRTFHSTLLATPERDWERLKIGGGTPPFLTSEGWVLYYHGVEGIEPGPNDATKDVFYQAGVMVLDRDDPRKVLYRSTQPVLSPVGVHERLGIVNNVVFPTAVDVVGQRIFVYYGAADCRIAVATAQLESEILIPPSAP